MVTTVFPEKSRSPISCGMVGAISERTHMNTKSPFSAASRLEEAVPTPKRAFSSASRASLGSLTTTLEGSTTDLAVMLLSRISVIFPPPMKETFPVTGIACTSPDFVKKTVDLLGSGCLFWYH